jgi:hypothetical protein
VAFELALHAPGQLPLELLRVDLPLPPLLRVLEAAVGLPIPIPIPVPVPIPAKKPEKPRKNKQNNKQNNKQTTGRGPTGEGDGARAPGPSPKPQKPFVFLRTAPAPRARHEAARELRATLDPPWCGTTGGAFLAGEGEGQLLRELPRAGVVARVEPAGPLR